MKECIAVFAFLCRVYYYDDATYNNVKEEVNLRNLHQLFYRLFDKCFCDKYKKVIMSKA